jgi:hypothetical protein
MAPFPPIQSQISSCSIYFPLNKLCRPFYQLHPRSCYPVSEVNKWQQQPKLQQRTPYRVG